MKLNVIFSHKASNINKKLIKFFQINLLNFNKANLVFDFEVAHPEESDKYKSMGITNYPVLVRDNEITLGTDKIIHYLKQIVDRYNKKILNKSITLRTVESEIAESLEKVQNKYEDVEIGSYPFFKQGRVGVSIVVRSEDQTKIDKCNSQILKFVNIKKIEVVDR